MSLSNTAVPKYYGQFRDAVIRGEIPVCQEISMEMNRIDDLIANPGIYYDDEAIDGWIAYCENELTLTDGSPLVLLDSFKLWAEQVFGWYYFVDRSVYEPNANNYGGHYINKRIKKSTMIIRDNIYSVIDAVIYNREELIKRFENNRNTKNDISDEELLYDYISEFGYDSLKNINGDFAGAIYNCESGELVIFRDHIGVRPLYYMITDEIIAFSTDIRGLTGIIEANVSLNEEWVYKTLSGFISLDAENTEYNNIFCVKPGMYYVINATYSNTVICKNAYWQLGRKKVRKKSDLLYQKMLKELITDAVKRRI